MASPRSNTRQYSMSNAAPPTSVTHATHGAHRRWRRVGQNAGALAAARVVSGLCQLALVPLLLRVLGTETFGWAMALTALVGLSQFADLGVAMALQQKLSEAWARGDQAGLRRTYASGQRLLLGLGLGWLVVLAPAAWWLGRHALTAPQGAGELLSPLSWLIVAIAVAAGIPLSAGPRLAAAIQLGWIHAGWTAVANLGTLLAVWALARTGNTGTVTIISLLCASQVIPGWITAFSLSRRLRWQGHARAETASVWQLWHAGRKFAAPNLAGALLTAAAPAAVARFGGYAASAAFTALQRLFGTAQQAHAMVLAPLWPAWAEAAGHGEAAWVRHSLRLALGFTAMVCIALGVAAAAWPGIIHLWLGAGAPVPPATYAWLMAVWISATMFGQTLSYFLLSLGRLERITLHVAAAHVLTLAGVGLLGFFIGGTGVVTALAAGAALGTLPLFVSESATAWRELPRKNSTDDTSVVMS